MRTLLVLMLMYFVVVPTASAQQVTFNFAQQLDTVSVGATGVAIGSYSVSSGPDGCVPQYVQSAPPYATDFGLGAGQSSTILCYPAHVGLNQDTLHFRVGLDGSMGCTGEAMIALPLSVYAAPDDALHLRYQHPSLAMKVDTVFTGYAGKFFFSLLNGYPDVVRVESAVLMTSDGSPATLAIQDSNKSTLPTITLAPYTNRTTYYANVHAQGHSFDHVTLTLSTHSGISDSMLTIEEPVTWPDDLSTPSEQSAQLASSATLLADGNQLSISIESPRAQDYRIDIVDILGRPMLTTTIHCTEGTNELRLTTHHLTPGSYFCRITSREVSHVLKFTL